MTFKELTNPRLHSKPRFYENHNKLLQQSLLEPQAISLYLHENMLQHFDDVEDIANTFEIYSELDGAKARVEYHYSNQQYMSETETLNSLVESMAITEFNMHGGDYKESNKSSKQATMMKMAPPQFYEFIRTKRQTMAMIREQSKDR